MAMSQSELENIESFVRSGGVVISDAAPGVLDQHCAWQQNSLTNELFGINTPASEQRAFKPGDGPLQVTDEGGRWGLRAEELSGLVFAEPYIKAAGGMSLLRIGETDAVITHRIGKGWTIYLNTLFDKYPKLRAERFGGESYRTLVDRLLDHAGVRPAVKVLSADGKRLNEAQVVRYRFGYAEILAIVKDNVAVAGIAGRDGVTVYRDATLGQVARQAITIKLPQKYYVTDVRSGKSLGHTDLINSSVVVGDGVLFGLNPAENKLALTGETAAALGEHVSFKLSSSSSGPRFTLIRCHVFGPDGLMLPVYAQNLLMGGGSGTNFVLPSALSDAAGVYTIRATDVVSGATAETKITLK
jgi:hypothetical protein